MWNYRVIGRLDLILELTAELEIRICEQESNLAGYRV